MHARPETGLGTPGNQKIKFKNFQQRSCLLASYAEDIMLVSINIVRQSNAWSWQVVAP
jgi:hypothetical protein